MNQLCCPATNIAEMYLCFTIIMDLGSDCADYKLLDSFAGISGEILIHMLDIGLIIWILVGTLIRALNESAFSKLAFPSTYQSCTIVPNGHNT
jgi:hypothetical protein